ncbi:MAG: glycine zipper domain-containing protein [Pseudomonas sp.]
MAAVKDTQAKQQEIESGKESVMAAYNKLIEAKGHFTHAAEVAGLDLKNEALDQYVKGKGKAEELGRDASRFMHEKPLATVGIAFAAGFLLSQLMSRK